MTRPLLFLLRRDLKCQEWKTAAKKWHKGWKSKMKRRKKKRIFVENIAWKWKSAINSLLFLQFTVWRRQWQKTFSWKEGKKVEERVGKKSRKKWTRCFREKKSWINLPYTLSFVFFACFFSLAVGRGKVNLFHGIKDLFVLQQRGVCIQSEKRLIWKLIFEQIGSHIYTSFFCAYHKDEEM